MVYVLCHGRDESIWLSKKSCPEKTALFAIFLFNFNVNHRLTRDFPSHSGAGRMPITSAMVGAMSRMEDSSNTFPGWNFLPI